MPSGHNDNAKERVMSGKNQRLVSGLLLSVAALAGNPAHAQSYPQKPIRILTAPVGGALDIGARTIVAPAIAEGLQQPAIIENRQGVTGIAAAAAAAPDGYTLLVHGSIVWLQQFMSNSTPWDPVRDFAPITMAVSAPNLLVVPVSLPVKSAKELIALIKSQPGKFNYGSGASGTITHLAGEMFKSMTGTEVVRIPYGGTGEGLRGMLAGEIHMMFPALASSMPLVKAGKIKALAITTLRPSPLAPGMPTMVQEGLAGFNSGASTALLAPAKTSGAIVNQLHGVVKAYLSKPDVVAKLAQQGTEIEASTPAELAATMKTDMVKWGKVIKDAGIRDN
jgi:tripartite-type tricarboxylate transporter receptor subunit TctC